MPRVLSKKEWSELYSFLADHESDIANSINDYGELAGIFAKVIGRSPENI
jgi:hypothetical protein